MKPDRNKENLEFIRNKDFEGLLSANYRYIKQCANKYNSPSYQNDLEQVGKIAFWKAYSHYDEQKGVPFIKFAGKYISNDMASFLGTESRIIKTPIQCQKAYGKYMKLENPTEDDLKKFTKKQLEFIYSADLIKPKSLDVPVFEDSETPLSETICSIEETEPDNRLEPMLYAIKQLSPKTQDILTKYYGLNDSKKWHSKKLAKKYKCTTANITLIIRKAEKQIKLFIEKK